MNRLKENFTVSRDLGKMTVNEVWEEIQQEHKRKRTEMDIPFGQTKLEDFLVKAGVVDKAIQNKNSEIQQDNKRTEIDVPFGQTTLEDFLVKTGAVDKALQNNKKLESNSAQQNVQWMQYQIPQQQHHNVIPLPGFVTSHPISFGSNQILDATAMTVSSNNLLGTLSDTQSREAEKNVERRNKRMIKNRESAARSRARKQAYTNELEIKVTRLEEENEKLKNENKLEKLLPDVASPLEPKYQLRRTSSA